MDQFLESRAAPALGFQDQRPLVKFGHWLQRGQGSPVATRPAVTPLQDWNPMCEWHASVSFQPRPAAPLPCGWSSRTRRRKVCHPEPASFAGLAASVAVEPALVLRFRWEFLIALPI